VEKGVKVDGKKTSLVSSELRGGEGSASEKRSSHRDYGEKRNFLGSLLPHNTEGSQRDIQGEAFKNQKKKSGHEKNRKKGTKPRTHPLPFAFRLMRAADSQQRPPTELTCKKKKLGWGG